MLPQTRENALTVMGKDLDADREKLDGLRTNPLIRDVIAQEEVKQRVVEINETKQDILAAQNNIQLADCLVKAIDAGMLEAVLDESTGRYKFGTVKFVNAKNPVVRAALENLKKAFFEQLEAIKDSRTAKTPGAGSLKASVAERTNGNGNGHKNGKVK